VVLRRTGEIVEEDSLPTVVVGAVDSLSSVVQGGELLRAVLVEPQPMVITTSVWRMAAL
jgi:hypothetical protein